MSLTSAEEFDSSLQVVGNCSIAQIIQDIEDLVVGIGNITVNLEGDVEQLIEDIETCAPDRNPFTILKCIAEYVTGGSEPVKAIVDSLKDLATLVQDTVTKVAQDIADCRGRASASSFHPWGNVLVQG